MLPFIRLLVLEQAYHERVLFTLAYAYNKVFSVSEEW